MALASASGLGRPSVARLGRTADPSPPLSPRTADASARARAPADGAPASRATEDAPASAPFRTRRARAGTAGILRARAATAGARRGLTRARGRSPREGPGGERRVTRPDAPVAPPRARHAPRPRELHGRVPQETGGAAGGLRGRLVPGEHREPRAPAGKRHGGRRVGGCAVRRGGGQNLQLPKPRVGASEVEPQLRERTKASPRWRPWCPSVWSSTRRCGTRTREGTTRRRRSARRSAHLPETVRVFGVCTRRRRASRRGARACVGRTTTCSPRGAWGYRGYRPRGTQGTASSGVGIPGDVPWPGAPRGGAVPGGDAGAVPRRALEVRGEPLLPQLHAARGVLPWQRHGR